MSDELASVADDAPLSLKALSFHTVSSARTSVQRLSLHLEAVAKGSLEECKKPTH